MQQQQSNPVRPQRIGGKKRPLMPMPKRSPGASLDAQSGPKAMTDAQLRGPLKAPKSKTLPKKTKAAPKKPARKPTRATVEKSIRKTMGY